MYVFSRGLLRFFILIFAFISSAHASVQNVDEIIEIVESFLYKQASVYPGTSQISVQTPQLRQQNPCSNLIVLPSTGQRLRSRMTITVRCDAPESWSLHVQASVSVMGYYYVSNRNINVGETLSLDDLSPREGDLLRLPKCHNRS